MDNCGNQTQGADGRAGFRHGTHSRCVLTRPGWANGSEDAGSTVFEVVGEGAESGNSDAEGREASIWAWSRERRAP